MKRLLSNSALVLISLLLALMFGEMALRAYIYIEYFSPEHSNLNSNFEVLPKSPRAYGFKKSDSKLQTNSLGFRGAEFRVDKDADEIRLLMLGDSITAGLEFEAQETTSAFLQNSLARISSGKFKVFNLGVTGYNTQQQLATLKEVGIHLAPDIVILNLCLNDSDPIMTVWQTGLMRKAKINSVKDINLRTIIGSSYLLTFIKKNIVDLLTLIAPLKLRELNNPTILIDARITETAWSEMKAAIVEIRSLTEAQNMRFFIAIYPYASQVGLSKQQLIPQQDLAAFFKEQEIQFIDLIDVYEKADQEMFSDYTLHLTPYGSQQTSKQTALALKEAGYL